MWDSESARRSQLVGVLPVPETVKDNLASKDIVAEAIFSPPYAPLTFAWFYAFQLFNGMLA